MVTETTTQAATTRAAKRVAGWRSDSAGAGAGALRAEDRSAFGVRLSRPVRMADMGRERYRMPPGGAKTSDADRRSGAGSEDETAESCCRDASPAHSVLTLRASVPLPH